LRQNQVIKTNMDIGESPRPPEPTFSAEAVRRWDMDIQTMSSIRNYSKSKGLAAALTGGYAVEAYCGGKMTRSHGDMDMNMHTPDDMKIIRDCKSDITKILVKEQTKWDIWGEAPFNIEFRENNKDVKWEDRRRLELNFAITPPSSTIETRTLIDSQGNSHEVEVDGLYDFVTGKMRVLLEKQKATRPMKRPIQESDKVDFLRLVNLSEFDQAAWLKRYSGYLEYKNKGIWSVEEVQKQAEEQWQQAMAIVTS
jgi:hypothetical protein